MNTAFINYSSLQKKALMIVQRLKQCDVLGKNADPMFNTYFASESRDHDLLACRWHNVTNWNRVIPPCRTY